MKYLARVECSDHIAIVSGDDRGQVKRMATKIKSDDVKQSILDAVWMRKIDQVSTREIAEKYKCSLAKTRSILLSIANGTSGDKRFEYVPDREGVKVNDGSVFTYSPMDVDGEGVSNDGRPKHYIWFCS